MAGKRRDNWVIDQQDYDTEEAFRAAVVDELARFEHIGHRQGFGIVAAPVRQRIGGGIVTLGWQFRAERIPLVQAGQSEDLPEVEMEEDEEIVQAAANERIQESAAAESEEHADDLDREPASVATADPYAEQD